MKNIIKSVFFLFSLSIIIGGCDKVEFPYTTNGNGNGGTNDTVRKVLLEDFTGHTCNNCPASHKIADDLQTLYGKQLIVVAIHAGTFAVPRPAPFDYNFSTSEGEALFTYFGVSSNPIGMVNRIKQTNGSFLIDKGAFATEISKQIDSLSLEPDAYIHLAPTFNSNDSTLSVATEVTFLTSQPSGKYNLCIAITESEIIKPQKNNDPSVGLVPEILNYEHMHALRGMLTPALGDEILDGAPVLDQAIIGNYSQFKFGSDWVPENCHVVAFIYYADGPKMNQIIQAQEVKVK